MAEKPKSQSIAEKPEIEPRQTNHSNAVQLTLLDLWGMPIEEPAKKKKATKKENKAKRVSAEPYAANPYDDSDRIQNEAYNDLRPGVANLPDAKTIAQYETIFVGSPCW